MKYNLLLQGYANFLGIILHDFHLFALSLIFMFLIILGFILSLDVAMVMRNSIVVVTCGCAWLVAAGMF